MFRIRSAGRSRIGHKRSNPQVLLSLNHKSPFGNQSVVTRPARRTRAHVPTYTRARTRTRACTCVHVRARACTCVHARTRVHAHTRTHVRAEAWARIEIMYVSTNICLEVIVQYPNFIVCFC